MLFLFSCTKESQNRFKLVVNKETEVYLPMEKSSRKLVDSVSADYKKNYLILKSDFEKMKMNIEDIAKPLRKLENLSNKLKNEKLSDHEKNKLRMIIKSKEKEIFDPKKNKYLDLFLYSSMINSYVRKKMEVNEIVKYSEYALENSISPYLDIFIDGLGYENCFKRNSYISNNVCDNLFNMPDSTSLNIDKSKVYLSYYDNNFNIIKKEITSLDDYISLIGGESEIMKSSLFKVFFARGLLVELTNLELREEPSLSKEVYNYVSKKIRSYKDVKNNNDQSNLKICSKFSNDLSSLIKNIDCSLGKDNYKIKILCDDINSMNKSCEYRYSKLCSNVSQVKGRWIYSYTTVKEKIRKVTIDDIKRDVREFRAYSSFTKADVLAHEEMIDKIKYCKKYAPSHFKWKERI
ncbi:hypothetical protein ABMA75_03910 [Halobacteriovorax sp. ZH4_bin.1]|uniref:hypothetical protein n=1 Tax=unclassified Halobacteriovorax TaxID=2639665 RepID=UPI00371B075A